MARPPAQARYSANSWHPLSAIRNRSAAPCPTIWLAAPALAKKSAQAFPRTYKNGGPDPGVARAASD
eukprot:6673613-Pyramimonas_sp.AAC.1